MLIIRAVINRHTSCRQGVFLLIVMAMPAFWGITTDGQETGARTTTSNARQYRRLPGRQPRTGIPNQIGKNHELVRRAFDEIVESANRCVVSMRHDDRHFALGTLVSADGHVITKASEVTGRIECRIPGHGVVSAKKIATDRQTDLALYKVKLSGLTPINWSRRETPKLGSWVSIPSGRGEDPVVVGVISTQQHRVSRDAPVLGVHIENTSDGLLVTRVLPNSSAAAARMQRGDIIVRLGKEEIRTTRNLIDAIQRLRPNAAITVHVIRDGEPVTLEPRLGRATDLSSAEQGLLAHEGGPLSQRRSDFPRVIEHDCLVMPNQCGGPLIDVYGDAIGVNIARASRVSTYALPKDVVVEALKRMRDTQP